MLSIEKCIICSNSASNFGGGFYQDGEELYAIVNNNNHIAWKNVHFIQTGRTKITGTVAAGNYTDDSRNFTLKLVPNDDSEDLPNESEITFKIDDIIFQAWLRGGLQKTGIELINELTFRVTSSNASLRNLIFYPHEIGTVSLQFNFLTRNHTPQTDYTYHLVQTDAETEQTIGGEVFTIQKSPRTLFYAMPKTFPHFKAKRLH